MVYLVSRVSSALYRRVMKPILFRFSADSVHERMIALGYRVQNWHIVRFVLRKVYAFEDDRLRSTLLGITFKNPLGLSAGLDKDVKIPQMLKAIGFGFAECGSVTYGSYEGNKQPWYTRLPASRSIIVNSGLRSEGVKSVNKRVLSYPKNTFTEFPLNISIAKTNSRKANTCDSGIADYIASLKYWEEHGGATYYTINISCPNTFGGEPFTDELSLEKLLRAIDELNITRPLFVKMPIDKSWVQSRKLLSVCARHKVDGITYGNLYKDRSTVKLSESYDAHLKGNFSGKPCFDVSNELLARAYAQFGNRFVFSGVGGVFSAEDAYTKIKLGATFVQIITGLIFEGPMVVGQINRGLVALLEKDGFKHINDAVGSGNMYVKGKQNGSKEKQK
jgi:dihydroorotate dehydrogenase